MQLAAIPEEGEEGVAGWHRRGWETAASRAGLQLPPALQIKFLLLPLMEERAGSQGFIFTLLSITLTSWKKPPRT